MSDSEATAAAGPEVAPEIRDASPVKTPDRSSPTPPDTSTDVAPTRKARRRPDAKPPAKVEGMPKAEEQPAQALIRLILLIQDKSTCHGKKRTYAGIQLFA